MTFITKSHVLPGEYFDQTLTVKRVKQYLPASKKQGRKRALVQFFDQHSGGQYTLVASDIVSIK